MHASVYKDSFSLLFSIYLTSRGYSSPLVVFEKNKGVMQSMDETLALFETAFFAFATDFQRDKQNNSAKHLETDTRQRVAWFGVLKSR